MHLSPSADPSTATREQLAQAALVGPGSVSWRINREVVVLAGWSAAVLLQLAHPLVLQGVLDHSVFVADPSRRLERANSTVQSFLLLAFGTPNDVLRTADKINAIHDDVHGRLAHEAGRLAAGTHYSAHDPELLRWVHCTLIDVMPRTYELYVGPLSAADKDQYAAEAASVGPLLGLPEGYLPATMAGVRACMADTYASGVIDVTDEARWLAGEILRPPLPLPDAVQRLLKPALPALYWLNAVPTIGLLPARIRQGYHFRWTSLQTATLRAGAEVSRRLLPFLPPLMRHWPAARSGAA